MFEYAKIKADLEQIKCPVHAKTATVVLADGKINFENVCCDKHRKRLYDALPEEIEQQNISDILEDVY